MFAIVLCCCVLALAAFALQRWLALGNRTHIKNLPLVEIPPSSRCHKAIVVGAGMAGLCAARVLSDFFEEVLVLERDPLKDDEFSMRPGVPQGGNSHVVLEEGQHMLVKLFSTRFIDLLKKSNAQPIDFTFQGLWNVRGTFKRRTSSRRGMVVYMTTRPVIENAVRTCLLEQCSNVRIHSQCTVDALLTEQTNGVHTVKGVKCYVKGSEEIQIYEADLVVNASGRSNVCYKWLQELDVATPSETVVNARVAYQSRKLKFKDGEGAVYGSPVDGIDNPWLGAACYANAPIASRQFLFWPIGDRLFQSSLVGVGGDICPTAFDESIEWSKGLAHSFPSSLLQHMEQSGKAHLTMAGPSKIRHYDRLSALPRRLLTLGDAFVTVNPLYAQGMTLSATYAVQLWENLYEQRFNSSGDRSGDPIQDVVNNTMRDMYGAAKDAWELTASEDLAWSTTEHTLSWPMVVYCKVLTMYINWFAHGAAFSEELFYELSQIIHLKKGLFYSLRPHILIPVIYHLLFSRQVDISSRKSKAE